MRYRLAKAPRSVSSRKYAPAQAMAIVEPTRNSWNTSTSPTDSHRPTVTNASVWKMPIATAWVNGWRCTP